MPIPPCLSCGDSASGRTPPAPGGALGAGRVSIELLDEGRCYRRAGSPPFGLPVLSAGGGFRDIERYEPGDRVRACGRDLVWSDREARFCDGVPDLPRAQNGLIVAFHDTAIAVTFDHIFLLADGMLRRADRLAPSDMLMGPRGQPVAIAALHVGDYLSGFFRIATSVEAPDASLDGHLLNTNGVVSGDYAVQVFARAGALDALFGEDHARAPLVGSPAYVQRYGAACLAAPELGGAHMRAHALPPQAA